MSKSSTPKILTWYGYLASKCLNVELFLKMIFGNKGGEEELGILGGLISQVTIFYFRSEYDAKKVCSACQRGYSHPLMSHNIQSWKANKQIVAVESTNITAPNCSMYKYLLLHRSLFNVILCITWKSSCLTFCHCYCIFGIGEKRAAKHLKNHTNIFSHRYKVSLGTVPGILREK